MLFQTTFITILGGMWFTGHGLYAPKWNQALGSGDKHNPGCVTLFWPLNLSDPASSAKMHLLISLCPLLLRGSVLFLYRFCCLNSWKFRFYIFSVINDSAKYECCNYVFQSTVLFITQNKLFEEFCIQLWVHVSVAFSNYNFVEILQLLLIGMIIISLIFP